MAGDAGIAPCLTARLSPAETRLNVLAMVLGAYFVFHSVMSCSRWLYSISPTVRQPIVGSIRLTTMRRILSLPSGLDSESCSIQPSMTSESVARWERRDENFSAALRISPPHSWMRSLNSMASACESNVMDCLVPCSVHRTRHLATPFADTRLSISAMPPSMQLAGSFAVIVGDEIPPLGEIVLQNQCFAW